MADLAQAHAAAELGMQRALDFQARISPEWQVTATAFLDRFARTHQTFTSEQCTAASEDFGILTAQPRAWGSLYVAAAKAGKITRIDFARHTRRHGAWTPVWESLIYGVPA